MKVRAKEVGYYGNKRRKEGVEFFLRDKEHFSKKWMILVDEKAKPAKRKPAASGKKDVESKGLDSNSKVI